MPYDYRFVMMVMVLVMAAAACCETFLCQFQNFKSVSSSLFSTREKNPDLFEKMQQTQTSDAPEPGVNDDIIVRLGPKCDSARSAVSAECFR